MTTTEMLDRGRTGYERHVWGDAYRELVAADGIEPLGVDDLERLAVAAYLVGDDDQSAVAWERAHQRCLDAGDVARAVRCAFWLALGLFNRGEAARGGGWLGRARRLLDEHDLDCAERGYLLVPAALGALEGGDPAAAHTLCEQAEAVGGRFSDPDLTTLGRLGQGQALVRMDRTAEGIALLDEVMVGVASEEVSPVVAGTVYCAVILICREAFDLRRAQEWTRALSEWCEAQPDMVPFRGQCLVHRSQLLQFRGNWGDAMEEAGRACRRLSDPPGQPALGMALYQQGELWRLRGDYAEAERAYLRASECGREPQPGLALLRLAQGKVGAAAAAIRRLVDEAGAPTIRAELLAASVEILLAAGEIEAGRARADELAGVAAAVDAPLLHAMTESAAGAVLLAEGDARGAMDALRRACRWWRELEAPYEHARTRVLVGLACRDLGDAESGSLEVDAARGTFQELGAAPDLARLDDLFGAPPGRASGLTGREVEVLALVATGRTNREIARELVVSEHTIRRHLQNIFVKLGVSSRAAATAYAVEHGLT